MLGKDVSPPFVLVTTHPHSVISLSDQPAKDFHNHVIIVEHQEGIDFSALASPG